MTVQQVPDPQLPDEDSISRACLCGVHRTCASIITATRACIRRVIDHEVARSFVGKHVTHLAVAA